MKHLAGLVERVRGKTRQIFRGAESRQDAAEITVEAVEPSDRSEYHAFSPRFLDIPDVGKTV